MLQKLFAFYTLMILISPPFSTAATFSSQIQTTLARSDSIVGDYWIGSEEAHINGNVRGDLIVAAREISIAGEVSNSAFAISQSLDIDGAVHGNVIGMFSEISVKGQVDGGLRVGARVVFIEGHVTGDVFAAGSEVIIAEDGVVDGAIYVAANSLWVSGVVNGKLVADVNEASIAGTINNDVKITVKKKLDLLKTASIKGMLTYKASHDLVLDNTNVVDGGISFEKIKAKPWFTPFRFIKMIWALLAAIIVALLIMTLWRRGFDDTTAILLREPVKTVAVGFVFLVLVPLVVLGSMIFIITIPAALIALTLYGIALYLAKIFTGAFLGHVLFAKTGRNSATPMMKIFLGLFIIYVGVNIPYIGGLILLSAIIVGVGAFVRVISAGRR